MSKALLDLRLPILLLALPAIHCGGTPSDGGVAAGQAVSAAVTFTGPVHPQASSALCLDVVGQATTNGAQVQIWACSGNANQQWSYDGTALRVYGDKCLDVTGGSTMDGTKLQIWDCVAGDPNQQWSVNGQTLVWAGKNKCLDLTGGAASNGTLVQSWGCTAYDANQDWSFNAATSPPPPDAGSPAKDAGAGGSASSAKARVLAFLAANAGQKTAIGIEDKDSSNPEADSNTMASMANDGQNPSFWSADWGFGSAVSERANIVKEGEKQWAEGAIVQYIYHACPLGWGSNEGCDYQDGTNPIKGSFGQLSDAQWADLTTSGGTLNGVWLARLDVLATTSRS